MEQKPKRTIKEILFNLDTVLGRLVAGFICLCAILFVMLCLHLNIIDFNGKPIFVIGDDYFFKSPNYGRVLWYYKLDTSLGTAYLKPFANIGIDVRRLDATYKYNTRYEGFKLLDNDLDPLGVFYIPGDNVYALRIYDEFKLGKYTFIVGEIIIDNEDGVETIKLERDFVGIGMVGEWDIILNDDTKIEFQDIRKIKITNNSLYFQSHEPMKVINEKLNLEAEYDHIYIKPDYSAFIEGGVFEKPDMSNYGVYNYEF